jgi:bacterioferritin-associated ferredoxin
MERPMPLPGWTIPGVMPCTAADVLYKNSGFIPDGEVVLAGSGPLLLLIGCRMLDVGVQVSAFLDTSMNGALLKALTLLPNALRSHKYLTRGLSLLWKIRKAGIPFYSGIQNIEALGSSKLEKVRIGKSGKFFDVKADLLLLHNGVVPNVQITRNLGCEHRWYDVQRYWEPIVDDWGNTSVDHVSIAGDCGRVAGAAISEVSGHLAALETVFQLGIISQTERDNLSQPHRIELAKHQHVRPFLDKLFQPSKKWLIPENDKTIACRCEEVKVREIRETVRLGIKDPDRLKSMTRCGMGYCQARMCGLTVSEIIADEKKVSPEEIGYFKVRSPIIPITLGQVAGLD